MYYGTRCGTHSVCVTKSTHSDGILAAAELFNIGRKSDGIESAVEFFQSLQLFIKNGEGGKGLLVNVPAAGQTLGHCTTRVRIQSYHVVESPLQKLKLLILFLQDDLSRLRHLFLVLSHMV